MTSMSSGRTTHKPRCLSPPSWSNRLVTHFTRTKSPSLGTNGRGVRGGLHIDIGEGLAGEKVDFQMSVRGQQAVNQPFHGNQTAFQFARVLAQVRHGARREAQALLQDADLCSVPEKRLAERFHHAVQGNPLPRLQRNRAVANRQENRLPVAFSPGRAPVGIEVVDRHLGSHPVWLSPVWGGHSPNIGDVRQQGQGGGRRTGVWPQSADRRRKKAIPPR